MAQVDFSNAKIEPLTDDTWGWADFRLNTNTFYDKVAQGSSVSTAIIVEVINDTATKKSFQYSGRFTKSGTEFYFAGTNNNRKSWRVYNISFDIGDVYAFIIDIELIVS